MSGVLKIVATVVAAVVAVFVPVLAFVGTALILLDIASLFPKPSAGGSQSQWKADPYAGLPYVMGRTLVSGNIVARLLKGTDNEYQGICTVLSLGPIHRFEATYMNKTTMTWSGATGASGETSGAGVQNASGTYANWIYEHRTLGLCPAPFAPGGAEPYYGWGPTYKLSGLASVFNSFAYKSSDKNSLTALPAPGWIIEGVLCYDPRQDSTYPGGSGACRALDESTYVYSQNPHVHALTWVLGRWQNGVRVAGIGAPLATIDMAAFVNGANLDDARDWKVGGQVATRPDTPWNSLKAMLQAGGSAPIFQRGIISCVTPTQQTSLATIGPEDIVGDCSFAGTQPRRSRINGIIPQYREEALDWQMVSAPGVFIAPYVTEDGDERTKEISYPLVQNVSQVSQLARLDIENSREAGPGSVTLKPQWLNYKVGDCVMYQPEAGWSIKVMITGRSINAQDGTVTYTLRGETDGKYAYALGQSSTAPSSAALTYDFTIAAPTGDWTLTGTALAAAGGSTPALVLAGGVTNANADAVLIDYRLYVPGLGPNDGWLVGGIGDPSLTTIEITSVTANTQYQVGVRYRVRGVAGAMAIFGPVTTGAAVTAVAGSITGQGALAVQSTAKTTQITDAAGATAMSDLLLITHNGTAAAISGQGELATMSALSYGSRNLTNFGLLAGLGSIGLGSGYLTGFGGLAAASVVQTTLVISAASGAAQSDASLITGQGTAAAIAGQSAWATYAALHPTDLGALATSALTDGQVKNTLVPVGGNLVPFSQFEAGTANWQYQNAGGAAAGGLGISTYNNQVSIYATTPAGSSTGYVDIYTSSSSIPVTGGAYYTAQGFVDLQGCFTTCRLEIQWFDGSGGYLTSAYGAAITPPANAWAVPLQMPAFQAPATAVACRYALFCGTSSTASGVAYLLNPMISPALAGQTTFPVFTPGPNAYNGADVTATKTAAAIAGQGALATQSTAATTQVISAVGGTAQSDASLITVQGTAQAINGQAPAATDSTIQSGATYNAVFYQAADPSLAGGVGNGAFWVMPGGSCYVRNLGAWQMMASPSVRDGDILFARGTAGSGTFTVPTTTLGFVTVTIVGGRGGAGYTGGNDNLGGSGSYGVKHFAVAAGDVISFTLSGNGPNNVSANGGNGSGSTLTCSVHGVSIGTSGGAGGTSSAVGAGGAANSGGDTNTAGTAGGGSGIYAGCYVQIVAHST